MNKYEFPLTKGQNKKIWKRFREELGRKLYELRAARRLNQDEVCQLILMPSFIIDNMELGRGEFNMAVLISLCRLYGVKPEMTFSQAIEEVENIHSETAE